MDCRSLFNIRNIELRLLLTVAFFFVIQNQLTKPQILNREDYITPPIEIKYLTAGFSPQVADSFWLRAVQDMDHCDNPINERECHGKSWLFNVINLTVELDNKFKDAYYYGGLALTILISDYEGATIIFDKGVANFSKDWPLLYAAGYHALYEEKNSLKASKLYLAAADNGAPAWLRLTAGRLASEGGDDLSSKIILQQLIKNESDPVWIKKLQSKIREKESTK